MMKAVVVYEPGSSDKLIFEEVPKPELKEGWSLIKVKGFGINRSEIFYKKRFFSQCQISENTRYRMCRHG